jgi:hypothetical protein
MTLNAVRPRNDQELSMLYHVSRNGQNYGPYTIEDLQRYVATGNVLLTDLAKSDEMAEWTPVAQVLGVANPAPAAAYPAAAPAYPPGLVPYPDPPNLHWALVLLIAFFTCGIFSIVWLFVEAAWVRKVDPHSKAIFLYIGGLGLYVCGFVAQISMKAAQARGDMSPVVVGAFSIVWALAYCVLFIWANFSMRESIEEHFNGPEPIGLELSGVMTFFFSLYYFQYHFSRINELKRIARYRGAAI